MKSNLITIALILIKTIVCNGIDVKTSSGLVRGLTLEVLKQKVNQFLSIPFAEPPVGHLRFAKPVPIGTPLPVRDRKTNELIKIINFSDNRV